MLKKEVNETIKQTLIFLAIVIAAPLLIMLVTRLFGTALSYDQLFFPIFQVGTVIFATFMGISPFSRDMKDRGMEYLLTLPYTRLRLLGNKLLPRFLATAAVLGIYILLLSITGINPETSSDVMVLPTGIAAFLCISLFFIGIPFSISRGGIVIAALATFFGFLFYLFLIYLIFPTAMLFKGHELFYDSGFTYSVLNIPGYFYFAAGMFLLGSVIAFVYAFKQFNLGPVRSFIKRYLKVFIPIFVIAAVISVVWATANIWTPQKHYILTDSQQLIETNYITTRIYDTNSVTEADLGNIFWLDYSLVKDNYFYTISYTRYDFQLLRLDLKNPGKEAEILYKAKGDTRIRGLYAYRDQFAFFEINKENYKKSFTLVLLKPGTGVLKRIEIPYRGRSSIMYPKIFGADEIAGKRYWLIRFGYDRMNLLYRVWEEGTMEDLGRTDWPPVYTKGMLITGSDNSIIFSRLTMAGMEIIKTQPVGNRFTFFYPFPNNLEQRPIKELYGWIGKDMPFRRNAIYRLDLETLEISEVKELQNTSSLIAYSHPDKWYYTELVPKSTWRLLKLKKLYRLADGKPILQKEFGTLDITWDKDYYGINNTGMVVKVDGKTRVYSLPELKELQFKELK